MVRMNGPCNSRISSGLFSPLQHHFFQKPIRRVGPVVLCVNQPKMTFLIEYTYLNHSDVACHTRTKTHP